MTVTAPGSGWRWRCGRIFLLFVTWLYLCSNASQATISRSQKPLRTTLGALHSLHQRQAALQQKHPCANDNNNCTCPDHCSCQADSTSITQVTCSHITTIPATIPSSTTSLTIRGNLTTLDDQQLGKLHQLEKLSLSECQLRELNPTTFDLLVKLQFLDLSTNQLSRTLPPSVFQNLVNLRTLNLSANAIGYIDNETLLGLDSVSALDLSRNSIEEIDEDAFQSLVSLQLLDLSHNLLTNLSVGWFRTLSRLRVLLLDHNHVTSLENHLFQTLTNLQVLSASGNELVRVEPKCFVQLTSLTHLRLDDNKIHRIDDRLFNPLVNLENLNLSANPLSTIDNSQFATNSKLTVLRLDHLPNLTDIPNSAFQGLHQLDRLSVSNNPSLHFLHPDSLTPLTSLQHLDLSGNNLTVLHHHTFSALSNLKELALHGNAWNCDCYLEWLAPWVNRTSVTIVGQSDSRCSNPTEMKQNSIFDNTSANCSHTRITNSSGQVYTRFGSSALLECQAVGNPPPSLTWVLPKHHVFHLYPPGFETHWFIPYEVSHSRTHARNHPDSDPHMTDRIRILKNGNLYISQVLGIDAGTYICMASNALGNDTTRIKLTLNYQILIHVKVISILVGLATSIALLLMLLIFQLINMALNRWGCCCCQDVVSPKAKQIRKMLEGIEQYKSQQLDRLRDNYTMQVSRIKDNCTQQMDRIRDSYGTQVDRLRDIRDFGTQQIDKVRDQYYEQVKRVRDYSSQQMSKVRENYIFQRNRIRKFSAHQMIRLRENYKLQQLHLNKILETLNIESCRTGCSRSGSLDFNDVMGVMDPVFDSSLIMDSLPPPSTPDRNSIGSDQLSIGSDYFTPVDSPSHHYQPKCPPPTPNQQTPVSDLPSDQLDAADADAKPADLELQVVHVEVEPEDQRDIAPQQEPPTDTLTELVIDSCHKTGTTGSSRETSV